MKVMLSRASPNISTDSTFIVLWVCGVPENLTIHVYMENFNGASSYPLSYSPGHPAETR